MPTLRPEQLSYRLPGGLRPHPPALQPSYWKTGGQHFRGLVYKQWRPFAEESILVIKREDAIRSAWQQVILVRMAGLEARTAIWNEAVTRWAEEDLQFSSAMEARIQEVELLTLLWSSR